MRIRSRKLEKMEVEPPVFAQRMEKMRDQFGRQIAAYPFDAEIDRKIQICTTGEVDRSEHERIIQWYRLRTESRNSAFFPERLGDCPAEGDSHIFDKMVMIHTVAARA